MKIILGDFNAKVGREYIFKLTNGNESLHQVVKIMVLEQKTLPHQKIWLLGAHCSRTAIIHRYTWTSPDGKTHNQTDHILIDRRSHSSILDVQSVRGAECDTDHYLVVAKCRDRWAVSK